MTLKPWPILVDHFKALAAVRALNKLTGLGMPETQRIK
ncbi:hypothetical protein C942_02703 [Photobacterium marinum]|uniref:Mobile element protein n=1 Tax=Photobacterium marinum TaxID=1056511 RepID=L8JED1_9GAMM|nr:hypothetical protein C942_02703 [Photobacterium marinum]